MTAVLTPLIRHALLPLSVLALAATAQAGSAPTPGWNEATNGDFSGDGLTPNFVSLLAGGSTSVIGTTGRPAFGDPVDRDYFTITIPAGFELSALTVLPGTVPLINVGFIAVMNGSTFTVPPDTQSAAGLLGFSLYSENDVDTDILPSMGGATAQSLGATGFNPPLPAGNYAFWVQETGVGVATYGFSFAVTAVPEPATALTLLAGLALLGAALKRR
jgi:PEP-CTERM motif